MFKLALPLLILVSSNAFAGATCFVAQDNSQMSAAIYNEEYEKIRTEEVVSAALKIEDESDMYEGTIAILDVQTTSGLKGSVLAGLIRSEQRYQVECDGGSMTVSESTEDGKLVKADGLRTDIEGCDGNMIINTNGTTFTEVMCEAPRGN